MISHDQEYHQIDKIGLFIYLFSLDVGSLDNAGVLAS